MFQILLKIKDLIFCKNKKCIDRLFALMAKSCCLAL